MWMPGDTARTVQDTVEMELTGSLYAYAARPARQGAGREMPL